MMAFINYLISTNIPDLILYILISYVAPILWIVGSHYYKRVNMFTVFLIGLVEFNILSDLAFAYDLWVEHIANSNAISTSPINGFVEIQDDLPSTESPKVEESSASKESDKLVEAAMLQACAGLIWWLLRFWSGA